MAATPFTHGAIPPRAGIGLRFPHQRTVREGQPAVPWFEVHSENYFGGGAAPQCLDAIRSNYPISLHGIGLSLGSAEGVNAGHLECVAEAAERFEPGLVSEHLAWTSVAETYLADLLPLPLTEEALAVVCANVDRVQSRLKRSILIENPSTYLRFRHSVIPEPEFLAVLAQRTGCGILCDVNNIYVSACNHGWNASSYLAALPAHAVREIHLAGHAVRTLDDGRQLRIDDHGSCVIPAVWLLYAEALARFGPVPTLIEWDTDIPPFAVLQEEAAKAAALLEGRDNAEHYADAA